MTDTELLELIEESRLLTQQEKVYWNTNIAHMNPEQKARLEDILLRAKRIPWNKQIQKYLSLVGTAFSKKAKTA